jgi:hypothetical protein
MQGTRVTYAFHVPGTLAANLSIKFTLPFDAQLVHVSAVGSNSNNGILDVGSSTDDDAYVDALDIGDSGVPAECDELDDFASDVFPHIVAGTIVACALDYDGASGTAAHDFTLVLTFTEG